MSDRILAMTLLGPIATPLRALLFALGGAGLAWAWYDVHPVVPIAVVLVVWFLMVGLQVYADSQITKQPLRALRLMELRLLGIVVVSAGLAALVIVITVSFTIDEEAAKAVSTSTKEVIAAVGASLTAFIGAVSVSAEGADESIGDLVKEKFTVRFVREGAPAKRNQVALPVGSDAHLTVFSSREYGWTDWSKEHRLDRVTAIENYLRSTGRVD